MFLFICLKDSASLLFWFVAFFSRGHTPHVFHLCFVPVLFSFVIFVVSLPCRPKHVVKDSENQNTIKLHADGNIACNNH
jgi:hypothetical protein